MRFVYALVALAALAVLALPQQVVDPPAQEHSLVAALDVPAPTLTANEQVTLVFAERLALALGAADRCSLPIPNTASFVQPVRLERGRELIGPALYAAAPYQARHLLGHRLVPLG